MQRQSLVSKTDTDANTMQCDKYNKEINDKRLGDAGAGGNGLLKESRKATMCAESVCTSFPALP